MKLPTPEIIERLPRLQREVFEILAEITKEGVFENETRKKQQGTV